MSGPLVLGIETSCDETGVAVLEGMEVRSSVLASQVELHERFGGVVPEVAARAHVEAIRPLAHRALTSAGIHPDDLDAVAVTRGPGLVGALMVGYAFGTSLAYSLGKPLYGIDHMEGHLFAPRLAFDGYEPPAVVLLASGGHSQLVHVKGWGDYEVLGGTIDDAAGEAFDKLARFMGLGFPGGPAIDADAEHGDASSIRFPRALADRPYDFSFSGLKTSVVTYLEKAKESGSLPPRADVSASIQEAIAGVDVVGGGGGVLANRRLRERLAEEADRRGVGLFVPEPALCTDNGAMIASVAVERIADGRPGDQLGGDVDPGMRLGA